MDYTVALIVLSILVFLTNIIVQVIKDFSGLKDKPTRIVATMVAITLCVLSTIAYCQIYNIIVTWYIIVSSVILGFIVTYGSIYGFDILYGNFLDKVKELLTHKK